jgi:hypothetical protein
VYRFKDVEVVESETDVLNMLHGRAETTVFTKFGWKIKKRKMFQGHNWVEQTLAFIL